MAPKAEITQSFAGAADSSRSSMDPIFPRLEDLSVLDPPPAETPTEAAVIHSSFSHDRLRPRTPHLFHGRFWNRLRCDRRASRHWLHPANAVRPVVSGIGYDVTGAVRPVVFLPGRVNGQYILEGLSSGFMVVLGGMGIVLMDLAFDKNRAKSVKVSYASAGISSVVLAYVMSMLFIRIKIPGYLR